MTRVLIIGLARSGTTWLGQALSGAADTTYVDEPDNHYRHPFAFRVKATLPGRAYPILGPGDAAPEYTLLWERAFSLVRREQAAKQIAARSRQAVTTALYRGVLPHRFRRGPRLARRAYAGHGRTPLRLAAAARLAQPVGPGAGARHIVVKSVYAALCAEWLAEQLPVRVLIVRRDLRGVVASWKAEGWLANQDEDFLDELGPGGGSALAAAVDAPQPANGLSHVGRVTWLLACLASALRSAAARHPDWTVASYEELVGDSRRLLPELAAKVGIGWSPTSDAKLRGRPAPPPRTQGIDPRLSIAEADEIASVLSEFNLRGWSW